MAEIKIKELAEAIKNGNEEAFRDFYDLYFERIYRFLCGILKNEEDAEDVTSQAFFYVWNNRSSLRKPEQLVSWLYQIAKHRAFDLRRKNIKVTIVQVEDVQETIVDGKLSLEGLTDQYFASEQLYKILDSLSIQDKSILYLRFIEDLDFNSVARKLGTNSVAVRVRLHRILKKLQNDNQTIERPSTERPIDAAPTTPQVYESN